MGDEQERSAIPVSPSDATRSTQQTARSTKLATLRAALRRRRNALSPIQRRMAALKLTQQIRAMRLLRPRLRIGVYATIDGEIDVDPVSKLARSIGCRLYVPQITDRGARIMEFIPLPYPARPSVIHAPPRRMVHQGIDPRLLDVVFVPLVAFDMQGWRLGFGAGFYDRKFAFLRLKCRHKPLLIGVGYEFQRMRRQSPQPWDVFLDAAVTERRFYRFSKRQILRRQ